MSTPVISASEFAVFIKRSGIALTPEQIAEYYEAYGYVEAMAARLRTPRSYMAEPAHTYGFAEEAST